MFRAAPDVNIIICWWLDSSLLFDWKKYRWKLSARKTVINDLLSRGMIFKWLLLLYNNFKDIKDLNKFRYNVRIKYISILSIFFFCIQSPAMLFRLYLLCVFSTQKKSVWKFFLYLRNPNNFSNAGQRKTLN